MLDGLVLVRPTRPDAPHPTPGARRHRGRGRRCGRDLRARRPAHRCSRASDRRPRRSRPSSTCSSGVQVVTDNGVEVLVPPLHHAVVTAKVAAGDLGKARAGSRGRARRAGVAVPRDAGRARRHRRLGPARTSGATSRPSGSASSRYDIRAQSAGAPRRQCGSRATPRTTELEQNDVAVLLRSDSLDAIAAAEKALFDDLGVLTKTTVRRGFAGGGLPSKLAVAAGVPGADLIPPEAELFLGFTSTLRENLGPSRIANLETLGLARIPQGYFTHGTHMHLSHIHENLEAWYVNSSHDDRVHTTFRPGLRGPRRDAHRAAGPGGGLDRRRRPPELPGARRDRAQRRAADGVAARAPPRRPRRHGVSGRCRDPAARRLQHARQPVRLERRRQRLAPIRRPASTSSSSTRRATTSTACAARWTACCPTGRRCRSSRGPRARASTASSARRGARTSSCRRAPTARSRSPSSAPGPARRGRLRSRRAEVAELVDAPDSKSGA